MIEVNQIWYSSSKALSWPRQLDNIIAKYFPYLNTMISDGYLRTLIKNKMETIHTDRSSDSFSNSSSERRTSQRKRKETKFFTVEVGQRKSMETDVQLECKVKDQSGFTGLSSSCSISANSTWNASNLMRKLSKEINMPKMKLKIAYYDTQAKSNH